MRPSAPAPLAADPPRSGKDTRPRPAGREAGTTEIPGNVGIGAGGQNERVSLARAAWLATVAGFIVAALLLLVNGYFGYFLVLLAVAFAAAVNLLR